MGSFGFRPDPSAGPPPDRPRGWEESGIPEPPSWIPGPPGDSDMDGLGPQGRSRFLLTLMRRTGLLLYDEHGLTPAAFKNIYTSAFFLIGLLVIDFLAWTGLVNTFFSGSFRKFEFPGSALAALVGALMAVLILQYESTFLTSDFRRGSKFKWAAILFRGASVLFIAFATSLPIDLYLLEDQINQRIHQEQVLQQLPALVSRWAEAKARPGSDMGKAQVEAATVNETEEVRKAASDVETENDQLKAIISQRVQQQRRVWSLENSLAAVDRQDFRERERLTGLIREAKGKLSQLEASGKAQANRLVEARKRQSDAGLKLTQKRVDTRVKTMSAAGDEATRYETWIHDLWLAKPLATVTERRSKAGTDPWTYDGGALEGHSGIGERLIVLTDVLSGEPPRRPKMTEEDRRSLAQMGLAYFVNTTDAEAIRRQQSEAASLRRLMWTSLGGFTMLPLLIIAAKLLFDEDTKLYYSREYQRRTGYPGLTEDPKDGLPSSPGGRYGSNRQ